MLFFISQQKTKMYLLKINRMKLCIISILLSFLALCIAVKINYDISIDYLESTGKNRALFSLIELTKYNFRYYFVILGLCGFIISLFSIRRNEDKKFIAFSVIFSLIAILASFISLWQFFI